MTINPNIVETDSNRIDHNPDGINSTFTYNFQINDVDWIQVYADGEVYTEPYVANGIGNPTGGDLVFDTPPEGTIAILTIMRTVPLTQEISYPTFGPFPAESHEAALDKLTFITQQHAEELSRALKASIDIDLDTDLTLPPAEADKVLLWNSVGDALINGPTIGTFIDLVDRSEDAADESEAARDLASRWAEEAEDVPVNGGFSAYHWSKKAEEVAASPDEVHRITQAMLTGPELEATPELIETFATDTGNFSDVYTDLNVDLLTGSRGGMTFIKRKDATYGTLVSNSLFDNYQDYVQTQDTHAVVISNSQVAQYTAEGIECLGANGVNNANLYAFQTTHRTVLDGNEWHYNPASGFAMCRYEGSGLKRRLIHPMGKTPIWFAIKNMDSTQDWECGRYGTTGYLRLNTNSAEIEFNPVIFPEKATDVDISIGEHSDVNEPSSDHLLIGWFGDPLDDLHPGMVGERGITASVIYPGGSTLTVDTGITDIQMIVYKNISSTGDWRLFSKARGWGVCTKLNTVDAESSDDFITSVDGGTVSFKNTSPPKLILVIGSTANASDNKLRASTKVLRKVGTGVLDHRVDMGAAYAGGNNGGMVFGRGVSIISDNGVFDTTMTLGNYLLTDKDNAEAASSTGIRTWTATGFLIGTRSDWNQTDIDQFTGFNTTHKVITSDGLNWSYNPLTGFGMCNYVGDGIAGRELQHPMGKKLRLGWFKRKDVVSNWQTYHDTLGATKHMVLNTEDAEAIDGAVWNNTEPTDTTITLGSSISVNASGGEYVMYGWFGDNLDTTINGERGASAIWQYIGGTGAMSVDTGIENITIILRKNSDELGSWQLYAVGEGDTFYNLNNGNAEGSSTSLAVEGSVVSYVGSTTTIEFMAFGSKADSGLNSNIVLPSSIDKPNIVSMTNGFRNTGIIDIVRKLESSQALHVAGEAGKKFIYLKSDGLLYFSDFRPVYTTQPQPLGSYVYQIDEAKMYDEAGEVEPAVFIGECVLDALGYVHSIQTYSYKPIVTLPWKSIGLPGSYTNPFGHAEITLQGQEGKDIIIESIFNEVGGTLFGLLMGHTPDEIIVQAHAPHNTNNTVYRVIVQRTF